MGGSPPRALYASLLLVVLLGVASADPYRTLGLRDGASKADVKKAYRKLAKKYHPDVAGEKGQASFIRISEAYNEITDPNYRPSGQAAERQQQQHHWSQQHHGGGGGGGSGRGRRPFVQMFRGPDGRVYQRVVYPEDEEPAFSFSRSFQWEWAGLSLSDPAVMLATVLLGLMGAVYVLERLTPTSPPPPPAPAPPLAKQAAVTSPADTGIAAENGDSGEFGPLTIELLERCVRAEDSDGSRAGTGTLLLLAVVSSGELVESSSDFALLRDAVAAAQIDVPFLSAAWVTGAAAPADDPVSQFAYVTPPVAAAAFLPTHTQWYRRLRKVAGAAGRGGADASEDVGDLGIVVLLSLRLATATAAACVVPGSLLTGGPSTPMAAGGGGGGEAATLAALAAGHTVGADSTAASRVSRLSDWLRDACDAAHTTSDSSLGGVLFHDVTDLMQPLLPPAAVS